MVETKVTKGKARQDKKHTGLKVMHRVDQNTDGTFSISSNAPKLKEAVDAEQIASETGHKMTVHEAQRDIEAARKTKTVKPTKSKDQLSEDEVKVLHALNKLGGTSESMPIAKHLGWDKKYPKGPRGHVRKAMQRLEKDHLVTAKREGMKYTFAITPKGTERANNPAPEVKDSKDKGANPAPASTAVKRDTSYDNERPSPTLVKMIERPANTDTQCPKCEVWNPFRADYCKSCGAPMKTVPAIVSA